MIDVFLFETSHGWAVHPDGFSMHSATTGLLAIAVLLIAAGLAKWLGLRPDMDMLDRRQMRLVWLTLITAGAALVGIAATDIVRIEAVEALTVSLAAASALTAFAATVNAWIVAPKLLEAPSRRDLKVKLSSDRQLIRELSEASQQLKESVADRAREVDDIKRRFEVALRGSTITVFSQDSDLRHLWMHNPPRGVDAAKIRGLTDFDLMDHATAERLTELKREVLAKGRAGRIEFPWLSDTQSRWFELVAEPYLMADGGQGVLCVAVEVTDRKRREVQLRAALREVTHRSKNMLSVLLGIARQTAARSASVETFMGAFRARLVSMSITQDLLIETGWAGVYLYDLVRAQAMPYVDEGDPAFEISGPKVRLMPEPAQNLGLALHELVRNAAHHGALQRRGGRLQVKWQVRDGEGEGRPLDLFWIEHGAAATLAGEGRGFGATMVLDIVPRALDGPARVSFADNCLEVVLQVAPAHFVAVEEPDPTGGVEAEARLNQTPAGATVP